MFPAFRTVTVDKLALGKNFKLSQTQKSKVSNQYESCSEYDLCKMISEDFADTLYLVPPIPTPDHNLSEFCVAKTWENVLPPSYSLAFFSIGHSKCI